MAIRISVTFLAGRYHATPWNHQVNEGVVEWPPSPWRILRAIVAASYRLPEPPTRAALLALMSSLTQSLPRYRLPDYCAAHTRHFMPVRKEGNDTTAKVIDTFYALAGGAQSPAVLDVVWPEVELVDEQLELLKHLCSQVSYLGRAESWAELAVFSSDSQEGDSYDAVPDEFAASPGASQTDVLVPLDQAGLVGFQAALAVLPKPKGRGKWQAPQDILAVLELDVAEMRQQRWHGIPGTRWASYQLLEPKKGGVVPAIAPSKIQPNFVRFTFVGAALPPMTDAVIWGDRFHRALINRAAKKDDDRLVPAVLTGQQQQQPRRDNHQHAFFLPEINQKDGKISYVWVYAKEGFDEQSIEAMHRLSWIQDFRRGQGGLRRQTALVSLGNVDEYEEGLAGTILGRSRCWRSVTPMVLPRFPKRYRSGEKKLVPGTTMQKDGPEHQVRRLLQLMGFDEPVSVVEVPPADGRSWSRFRLRRPHGEGCRGPERGYGFELWFETEQTGPISLGYAAHFGLGLFEPVD